MADFTAWNGCPEDPERTAWHWVEDADGLRPLLWRGGDWAESMDRDEWQDGFTVLSARDLRRARYHGPVATPPRIAALIRHYLLGAVT